jgi:uncharacterized protein YjdB
VAFVRALVLVGLGAGVLAACDVAKPIGVSTAVSSVVLSPATATLPVGKTVQLKATPEDASGTALTGKTVTWATSDPTIVTVDANGLVTAVAVGGTTITATSEGKSGTATITVSNVPVASVVVSPATATVQQSQTQQLTATPQDASGAPLSGRVVTWASATPAVATVDAASGLVTAVAVGTAAITATSEGKTGSATITVVNVPVASVVVSPATASVSVGATVPLTATPQDASGAPLSGRVVTWASGTPAVATVDASGRVTGVTLGSALITATSEGKSGSATITVTAAVPHSGWYASPAGTSAGAGNIASPWDLPTALNGGGGKVQPGDTIWLRGGTYVGTFTSNLSGTAAAPIVVRQFLGERAIIDGGSSLQDTWVGSGTYTYFWGFEVTNSDPNRSGSGSFARADQVTNYGAHNKYINLIVHDGGVGYYTGTAYPDVEIYGSIVYNIGYQGTDRGHGHAFYLKNDVGPVLARDNVLFNEFGYGFHVYTNSGSGLLNNIHLVGNVSFNSGTLSNNSTSANLGILGQPAADGIVVQDNFSYYSPTAAGTGLQLGPGGLMNGALTATGNYVVGGNPAVFFGDWSTASFTGNTVAGPGAVVSYDLATTTGITWGTNLYYRDPAAAAWGFANTSYGFAAWQTASRLGATDQAQAAAPSATQVFVRPNAYEAGRAHIIVYNWSRQGSVAVDVSAVLKPGDRYEVRNVQDLFGVPVASGTYQGGSIVLPLAGIAPPVPVGLASSPAPTTGPDFNVFLVTRPAP